jgi:hypothetical protein
MIIPSKNDIFRVLQTLLYSQTLKPLSGKHFDVIIVREKFLYPQVKVLL